MDRGAAPSVLALNDGAQADAVPPVEWAVVRKVGLVGAGMIGVAALAGLADAPPTWPGHLGRVLLVLVGAVTVGGAVSLRPDLWKAWAVGAAAALLAILGTPAHWDSFRLVFGVMAAIAVVWTGALLAPARYRLRVLSLLVVFHFTGIFLATTTPPQTPWVTEQAFVKVFNPYLQFLYLRNAYHFYSPEPGPASLLVFLLKTETGEDPKTGEKQYTTQWVVLPKRPADVKDPLGLTYFRRLSITEQLARGDRNALRTPTFEMGEALGRRKLALTAMPFHPSDVQDIQFQLPQAEVTRFILPSYASHVILENTPGMEAARKTTVKVYRVQHNMMVIDDFVDWRNRLGPLKSPYHPTWYRPFFLGEYGFQPDPDRPGAMRIELVNPQEPMLYWLVPIMPRPGGVPGDPNRRDYIDFMSIHALDTLNLSADEVDDPKFKDRVFDWSQLR